MSLRNRDYLEVVKVLTKYYGFFLERQSGSHAQLKHSDGRRITVPHHGSKPIKLGVMKSIISQARTTEADFLKHL